MGKDSQKIAYINWNEIPWKLARKGVEVKVFSGQGATLQLARLKPGHAGQPHSHPHPYEQISYLLSGRIDMRIGEDVYTLVSGSSIVIPPNVMHDAVLLGEEEGLVLDIFTPKRTDLG